LIKEEKALERIYQLTCQLAQKDKENELLKEEKQQKEHELKTRLLRSDKRFFEAVERINDTRREKKQLQHDLENLRTQLNQVKTENIIKNIQSERDREAMRIQSWEKRALETRGNLESVWQALGRSQNYAEELKRRNEALEEHIKAFNQRQVEAKIQEIPKD
jgi:predicted  nucleic acid-binding Zn-ribbon protein